MIDVDLTFVYHFVQTRAKMERFGIRLAGHGSETLVMRGTTMLC